jgi:putative glutamine amidotransferase
VDVDPARYGEERQPICDQPDQVRDTVELALVRWALADHKPILAICRGIQLLNVACGGALYQDVPTQRQSAIKHDYFPAVVKLPRDHLAHEVRVEPGSRLACALGTESCQVNSMHHQGIKRLAPVLNAVALAPDGLVEGVEMPARHFVVGVQWHPEELTARQEPARRLFSTFVSAASSQAT